MQRWHAVALCLVLALSGCATVTGPSSSASTPARETRSASPSDPATASTTPGTTALPPTDLPPGLDRGDVTHVSSLSGSIRTLFEAARDSDEWVTLSSESEVETFGEELDHVYADGRVWTVTYVYGVPAYAVDPGNASADERVVAYANLTARQRRVFDRSRTNSGAGVGPETESVTLPRAVRYRNQTYLISKGTRSFAYGAIDVDPYEPPTPSDG